MPPLATFRNPVISLWQSAINEVLARQREAQPRVLGEEEPTPTSDTPIMIETVAAAEAILSGQPVPRDVLGLPIEDCAQLYLKLILAEASGNTQQAAQLKNEIGFSTCDPLWAEVFLEYERFRIFGTGQIPYRRYQDINDFVLDLPDGQDGALTIALIADWGTGLAPAQQVLAAIGQQKPDLLIHLGDIYYSGTSREVQERFLTIRQNTPNMQIPTFTLSGNHDMYSGGAGYYWLLKQLGQPASYFCLRNADWQLLAMDTGLHDYNPGTVISNLTYLDPQEIAWHQDKIANADGRKTILLSHHQLFSAANSVGNLPDGKPLAVNPFLHGAFTNVLEQVELWLWGHEHNSILFDPYIGLQRGRCIGSAAVPTLLDQNPYTPDPNLELPPGQSSLPIMDPCLRLGDNGEFYNHGYALLTLSGSAATVAYYQVLGDGSSALLCEETIGTS
jgi:predicted phosphodiesterase